MNNHNNKLISHLIRELRKAKGMSQMDLAEKIGISYQQIQKYERGASKITVDRLKQMANAFDIPINAFFPSDKEMISEEPVFYGKLTGDEQILLQLFRTIKDKKIKKAILEFLKVLARGI